MAMFDDTPAGRWKGRNYSAGNCTDCGKDKGKSPYALICSACRNRHEKARRSKLGFSAWKAGSPGRPPLRKGK